MKKIYLLLTLMLLPFAAMADDSGSCGENVTYTFVEETGTLTISGTGAMTDYSNYGSYLSPWNSYCDKILRVIVEEGVTTIGNYAFYGNGIEKTCKNLISVSLPNGLTSIGTAAFQNCKSLVTISTPSNVTTIGQNAFDGCSGIISLAIPDGVTTINDYTFRNCSGLMSITLPANLTSIGQSAFYGCSGLTELKIPSSVTSIGSYAFSICISITSFILPDGITEIKESTFQSCSKLESVNIPNGVTSIGTYAFNGCAFESITIPNSVTLIGNRAFQDCYNLTSISIPSSVTNIGEGAFSDCSELTEVSIPEGLKTIKSGTFYHCSRLKTVTIPSTIEIIYGEAFASNGALELIIAKPTTPPTMVNSAFSNKDVPVRVPTGCVDAYKADDVWKTFTYLDDQTKHKLIYMVDGQVYKEFELEYGDAITAVDNPKIDGATFICWQYKNENGNLIKYDPEWNKGPQNMPAHDFFLYALFEADTYRLTYYVNDRKVYYEDHAYGDPITPYNYTAPEGYTFSGWTDLPETMPANDVDVYGTTKPTPAPADLESLVKAIDLIMNYSYDAKYDRNEDGSLDIGDIVLIVKEILANANSTSRALTRGSGDADFSKYTATQFLLKVPTGEKVKDISLTAANQKTHQLMYEKLDAQTFAVVVFSLDNRLLTPENGNIVTVVNENGKTTSATLDNVQAVTPEGVTINLPSFALSTGIKSILKDGEIESVYDLSGRKIETTESLKKGVYIINGRKMVVK